VGLLKKSSEWLLNVISDGLDFTKIEAGELVYEPKAMNLKANLVGICEVFSEVAQAKGIIFEADITGTLPDLVICDEGRLTQVLNNLLNNACKFTETGKVKLKVTAAIRSDKKTRLLFVVEDTGPGIAQENLKQIFEPFKQIKPPNQALDRGTGLGLAISSRLVELMGGQIEVTSTLGLGTTFSIRLDVATTSQIAKLDRKLPHEGIRWHRQPSILLVEDNAINQEVAITYLKHLGCKVRLATDGIEAVETVAHKSFDLILMDCQMPRMDGYEATRQIRLNEGGRQTNTIIALTAHITKNDRDKCFEAGMDDYIGKPYRLENLERLFHRWLGSLMVNKDLMICVEDNDSPDNALAASQAPVNNKSIHDLRNALSGVIGGVELALMSPNDPAECEVQLNLALQAARQAVDIASRLE
jgi:CheY-like chemotaxis protein